MDTKKYEYEDILEMFGGNEYFNENTTKFIYHSLNNDIEEAEYYKALCVEDNKKIEKCAEKLIDESKLKDFLGAPCMEDKKT